MRKLLPLMTLLVCAGAGITRLAGPSSALAAQSLTNVTFNWTSTNSASSGWPNCSSSITTVCVSGYALADVTNSASPVVISSTIAATATSYVLTPLPSAGSHTYALATVGVGTTVGSIVTSTPATATTTIPGSAPNPPAGLQVTP
jgi:hypothetical protein